MKANIIYIFPILLLAACSGQKEETATGTEEVTTGTDFVQLTPEQAKNSGIVTGNAEAREMHISLRVNGVIDVPPGNSVSVSAPLGGYLKKTTLMPGSKVTKGSVLATLEDQQYIQLQQDYLTAKNRMQYVESDYNRQKGLNETKATSDKTLQQAQSDFSNQRILVRSLAEKLRLIGISPERLNENNISRSVNLIAPISGFVTRVNANIGKYVNPADVIFELVNPSDLNVQLTVFENDASNLFIGQKVICTTNNHPGESYAATIGYITPSIGEDRATEVHGKLDKYSKDLFPGTFVNAEIQLNNAKVRAVPDDAVVKWENKNYVFTEESAGKFRLVAVETGNSNGGYTEIRSALPSKPVVLKNAYTLLMKMKNGEE